MNLLATDTDSELTDTERTARIAARTEATTPGPWVARGDRHWKVVNGLSREAPVNIVPTIRACDADFIAHAPEDISWLLDKVAALTALVGAQVEVIEQERAAFRDASTAQVGRLRVQGATLHAVREVAEQGRAGFWEEDNRGGSSPARQSGTWLDVELLAAALSAEPAPDPLARLRHAGTQAHA